MLFPGKAVLYVPVQSGVALTIRLELAVPHPEGTLTLEDEAVEVGSDQTSVDLQRPMFGESRLQPIEIRWEGPGPLIVRRLGLSIGKPIRGQR